MIIVPKRNERNNQRKSKSRFGEDWTRITGWLTVMPKLIEWYPKPEKWLKTELSISNRWRIEKSDNIGNEKNEWLKWLTRSKDARRRKKKLSARRTKWVEI